MTDGTGPRPVSAADVRVRPRYHGMSDPVPVTASAAKHEAAQQQAVHRMWLSWVWSSEPDRWLPGVLQVSVQQPGDLFCRNQHVIVVESAGDPVCSVEELARMDAPLGVVRDDD